MNKVDVNGLTEREFLAEYKPGDYDRPSVTVDMMVLRMKEDLSCMQVLLIKRKAHMKQRAGSLKRKQVLQTFILSSSIP